ncbi:MAG: M20 family metallo-hydrolase [Candidatus Dormibacteria bacterium]
MAVDGPWPDLPAASAERVWERLMRLAEHVEPGEPGWTRRVFSPAYLETRRLVSGFMADAGLEVAPDAVGNLIGRLAGSEPQAPALAVGSHTDTVAGGGRFDGMVGVVAAIEVALLLRDAGTHLRHPLWVVDFLGEEPNRFGLSCLGSRAVTGHLARSHLELRDPTGMTLGEALGGMGARADALDSAIWPAGALHGYVELHVEQAARLGRAGRPLGVVSAIVGIYRARIEVVGRPDHAGTTPMDGRLDAMQAAAQIICGIDGIGRRTMGSDGVATVGQITVEPNSPNVVAARAVLVAEMRSIDDGWLRQGREQVEELVAQVAARTGVTADLTWISAEPPVACSPAMRELLSQVVRDTGVEPLEVPSGASHDAAHIAGLGPMGMLFIPSRGGRSHCPEEWTDKDHVALGTAALLRAVLAVDQARL